MLELTHYVGEDWVVTPVVAPLFEAFRAIVRAVYHGLVTVAKSALLAECLLPTKEVRGGWENVDGGAGYGRPKNVIQTQKFIGGCRTGTADKRKAIFRTTQRVPQLRATVLSQPLSHFLSLGSFPLPPFSRLI